MPLNSRSGGRDQGPCLAFRLRHRGLWCNRSQLPFCKLMNSCMLQTRPPCAIFTAGPRADLLEWLSVNGQSNPPVLRICADQTGSKKNPWLLPPVWLQPSGMNHDLNPFLSLSFLICLFTSLSTSFQERQVRHESSFQAPEKPWRFLFVYFN